VLGRRRRPRPATPAQPQTGGTLTYLEPQTWTTLYPPSAGFYPNGGIVNNITDRLLYQNPETLELEPWIATDYTVNDDATEYTFDLRTDVTYSDGTPLTAANVVKNIDLYGKGDKDRALPVSEAINNYDHGEVTGDTRSSSTSPRRRPASRRRSRRSTRALSDATLDREREVRPRQREGDHRQRPVRHLRRADRHEDERHRAQGLQLGAAVAAHQGAAYLAASTTSSPRRTACASAPWSRARPTSPEHPRPDEAQFAAGGCRCTPPPPTA
jgi:peptide/nickel transport system substrate-binding protein